MKDTKDTYKTAIASTLRRYNDLRKEHSLYLRIIYPPKPTENAMN